MTPDAPSVADELRLLVRSVLFAALFACPLAGCTVVVALTGWAWGWAVQLPLIVATLLTVPWASERWG